MHRSAIAVAATAALVASGCAGEGDPPRSTSRSTSTATQPSQVAGEQDVDVGGRSLHLSCWGSSVPGEPTVLLLSGSGPTASSWEPFATAPALAGHHLCAYDRLGVGRSDALPEGQRTTEDQVDDLVALLDTADLQEPVVLVAHSLGSLPATGLVVRAAQRVAGVVMIEPWSPRAGPVKEAALPPEQPGESPELAEERYFLTEFRYDPDQNLERLLLAEEDAAAVRLLDAPGPLFGDLPVVVLQGPRLPYLPGLPRRYHRANVAAIEAGAREFADESTQGTFTTVEDTGHDIHLERPAAVVAAILDVLGE